MVLFDHITPYRTSGLLADTSDVKAAGESSAVVASFGICGIYGAIRPANPNGDFRLPRPITVRIKRLAHSTGLPLPQKMSEHAAGFDLHAAVETPLKLGSGEIRLVPCGFAMALPHGYEAQIRPRSGLASRHGIVPVNTPGTIDSDYRGEVRVPLINHGAADFVVERGMRIAQMIIVPVPPVKLVEVEELDETRRGSGGFGHTGS